jgi:hypothetical protein
MRIIPILKKSAVALSVAILFALCMAFPFGPLLPWSPIKPGYRTISYAHADLYYNKAEAEPSDYKDLDRMMAEAEAFHHLSFHKKVRVIECKDWSDCARAMPWMNVRGLGGVTLATGDVIFITPKLREKKFSTAEYLRHELSHAVLSQNTTILDAYKLNNIPWFFEGLAVSFGKQKNYYSRREFLDGAKSFELAKLIDPAKIDQSSKHWNVRFAYTAQRYFVEFLRMKFGEDRFTQFTKKCIADPDQYLLWFEAAFEQPFPATIEQYQESVRNGQWPPEE